MVARGGWLELFFATVDTLNLFDPATIDKRELHLKPAQGRYLSTCT